MLLQRPGVAERISGYRRHLALLHDPSWVGSVDEARLPRVGRRAMQLSGSLHQSIDMTLCTVTDSNLGPRVTSALSSYTPQPHALAPQC